MAEVAPLELWRIFLAVPLSSQAQQQIQRRLDTLRPLLPGVRWVKPEQVHLTLKFLGEVSRVKLPVILESATAVAGHFFPFTVVIGGLGVFPHSGRPRVLWLGLRSQGNLLERLAAELDTTLERAGFPAETRPFSPHLTLGRVKTPLQAVELHTLRELLEGQETARMVELSVKAIHVLRSELLPRGPRYTILQECLLRVNSSGEQNHDYAI